MEKQNIEMEEAGIWNEARGQVYDRLITNIQDLDKEHLLELFTLIIDQIKTQDNQLFEVIYALESEKLGSEDFARSYQNITKGHISYIDGVSDRIIKENNRNNTQTEPNPDMVLPGNILQ